MRNTIYATFTDPKMAERAAGALLDHGLKAEDLSIIQSHNGENLTAEEISPTQVPATMYVVPNLSGMSTGVSPFAMTPLVEVADDETLAKRRVEAEHSLEQQAKSGISVTTAEDAEAGAIRGAAWGAGIGTAAAIAALFVPGVGLVIGGGALATAIVGLAASTGAGAGAGAVTGYLKDQGVDRHIADEYETVIQSGGAILGATMPSGNVEEGKAWEILTKYAGTRVTSYVNKAYVG